jgi:hypothetical protein
MKNLQRKGLLWILASFVFLFNACEKQKNPYDLFPLKTGNEYYYRYEKRELPADTKGTETWKVVSESSQGGSIKYMIERKLNAIITLASYKIVITDSITYLEVTQDKSSSKISLWGFLFKRYQSVSKIELKKIGDTGMPSMNCIFKADSGMTKYNYHQPPNQVADITLSLDSLKTTP